MHIDIQVDKYVIVFANNGQNCSGSVLTIIVNITITSSSVSN